MSVSDSPVGRPGAGWQSAGTRDVGAANRFGLDYREEAKRLPALTRPIIDIHAHINGTRAAEIYGQIAADYGIERVFTQVRLEDAARVRGVLGDRIRFIAFPNFRHEDRAWSFGPGYLEDIRAFRGEFDARIVKFWNSPKLADYLTGNLARDVIGFDSPWRIKAAELAQSLGMMFMVHVADPTSYFKTVYADHQKYGTKPDQYRGLEVMLRRFEGPWIAAHMGGSPEDLDFLDGLMERHANLYLDTSATKWVVRELSRHPRERVQRFFARWAGRLLFGSDIVTIDDHLRPLPEPSDHPMATLASSEREARDLYASRYFALRTMFETGYEGESPIADPDLAKEDASIIDPLAAPRLRGIELPEAERRLLYGDAVERMLARVGAAV